MEYVASFMRMQRFDDSLLVEVLEAMRTSGGKNISEEAWQALKGSVSTNDDNGIDPRLISARGWYECAYEWRIVFYAMHIHATLNAKAAGKILFYIPSIDVATGRMNKADFDEMRAMPNIATSVKFRCILFVFFGM